VDDAAWAKRQARSFFEFLGLGPEWELSEMTLKKTSDQVTLDLSLRRGAKVVCPECGESCASYDHDVVARAAASRHDAEDGSTRPGSQADCPVHVPQTIRFLWADAMARFTLAFEAHAIDVLEDARSTVSVKPTAA